MSEVATLRNDVYSILENVIADGDLSKLTPNNVSNTTTKSVNQ